MAKQNDLLQITKMLKATLKDEIAHYQRQALKASKKGDTTACATALERQARAINALIKLIG